MGGIGTAEAAGPAGPGSPGIARGPGSLVAAGSHNSGRRQQWP